MHRDEAPHLGDPIDDSDDSFEPYFYLYYINKRLYHLFTLDVIKNSVPNYF